MKIKNGIKTIALKVSSADFEEKRQLAGMGLGAEEVYTEPGLSVFRLEDGCLLELYGPGSSYPDFLFESNAAVLSFRVKDLEVAMAGAKAAGLEILTLPPEQGSCLSYCYLRDKNGTIFGLTNY